MVQTAEQKTRIRFKNDLRNGIEPPTRKETSRRILEEVRAELAREVIEGKGEIAAEAAKGKKSMQDAGGEAVLQIKGAADMEKKKINEYAKAAVAKAVSKEMEECSVTTPFSSASHAADGRAMTPTSVPSMHGELPAARPQEFAAASRSSTSDGEEAAQPSPAHLGHGALDASEGEGEDEAMDKESSSTEESEDLAGCTAADGGLVVALRRQPAVSTGAAAARQPPPAEASPMSALTPYEPPECNEWVLLQEAETSRRVAAKEEMARLAPEYWQQIRRAYERLAPQHAWPPMPAALPQQFAAAVDWFFDKFFDMKAPSAFQSALVAKRKEAAAVSEKLKKSRRRCTFCQIEARVAQLGDAKQALFREVDGAWEVACAQHKALTAIEEVRLEMELRSQWAERAVLYAVGSVNRQLEAAERARLASLAREEEDAIERERRDAVRKRARASLDVDARECAKCNEADWRQGSYCSAHGERLEALCERLNGEVAGGST